MYAGNSTTDRMCAPCPEGQVMNRSTHAAISCTAIPPPTTAAKAPTSGTSDAADPGSDPDSPTLASSSSKIPTDATRPAGGQGTSASSGGRNGSDVGDGGDGGDDGSSTALVVLAVVAAILLAIATAACGVCRCKRQEIIKTKAVNRNRISLRRGQVEMHTNELYQSAENPSYRTRRNSGPPITHSNSKWRYIWIRHVFCCRIPALLVAGVPTKTRLESSTKNFKPHLMHG